jgi:hypothetical protein
MPKLTERERLSDLETRQRKLQDEIEAARSALRSRYAAIVTEMPVETLIEREFRDILQQAIRVGGPAAVQALKSLTLTTDPKSRTAKA